MKEREGEESKPLLPLRAKHGEETPTRKKRGGWQNAEEGKTGSGDGFFFCLPGYAIAGTEV